MAIVRYNPWTEMNSLQRQLNRMLDDAFTPASLANSNFAKVPAAELIETEESLVLKLEVPGMNPGDIEIEATAKSISISGERKSETTSEDDKASLRTEFHYGSFQRVISLPARIQNTEVKAEYKNGILYLTLPKAEAEKNKVVKVSLLNEADA